MNKYKNLLFMLIISVTVIHCSQPERKNSPDILGVLVENNKFQYAISENNQYTFHDYETDEIVCVVDSLYYHKIAIDDEIMFVYENVEDDIHIYNIELELIEKLDGWVKGATDSSLVILRYLSKSGAVIDDIYGSTKIEAISLTTYPVSKEIIVKELVSRITIDDKLCSVVLDTLGVISIYDDSLTKIRALEADEYIGDDGILHRHTLIDSQSFQYDEFVIDYADYKYEGLIQMEYKYLLLKFKKMYDELYCLSKNENEVILSDHKFNIIEKSEYIEKAKYNIFSIKGNIEIGIKPQGSMDWFLPGRNDSIYAQVEVSDSVFYEQYWYDSDSLNYRIANAENHYDSNVKTSLIKELADSYVDNPKRPLFLLEDDGFLFLNNELNVIFESEDALEKYDFNDSSILMLLREKYTDKKYLRLYSWKD